VRGRRRLKGPSGVALALCCRVCRVRRLDLPQHEYPERATKPHDVPMDKQADYEKHYRKYKDLPHPKITDVRAAVDIYPDAAPGHDRASYVLQNKTGRAARHPAPADQSDVETHLSGLPPHKVELDDPKFGFSILKLAQAAGAGRAPAARLHGRRAPRASPIAARRHDQPERHLLQQPRTSSRRSATSPGQRADRPQRAPQARPGRAERMAKLEDQDARANFWMFGADADWINFETTVSTSGDQIALAPGYLQTSWKENGRRYFQYKMDQKMMPFFAYLSAAGKWKGDWKGIPIEIYHDRKHAYNVDRMIKGARRRRWTTTRPVHALPAQAGAHPGVPELPASRSRSPTRSRSRNRSASSPTCATRRTSTTCST
jgi:ABC-2 type transport system permease protein